MTLKQLELLVSVADHGSISQAAEFIGVSQSSITMQIRLLEEELGGALLVRGPRGSSLTPTGERVVERARTIMREVTLIPEDFALDDRLSGTVTLGMSPLSRVAVQHFPRIYSRFHQQYPHIRINLLEIGAAHLTECIKKGEVELAIMPLPIFSTKIAYERLWSEELVLVAPKKLEEIPAVVPLSMLKDYPFVFMKAGYGLNYTVLHLTQDAGFIPHVAQEVSSIGALLGFVASGVGIAIAPMEAIAAESGHELLRVIAINPPAHRDFALVYRRAKDLSPAAQTLANAIRSYARELDRLERSAAGRR